MFPRNEGCGKRNVITITFLLFGQCWWFTKIARRKNRDKVKLLKFQHQKLPL